MACRLDCAKPLSETMMDFFHLTLGDKFQWNLNRNSFIFIQENAFENVVWKMTAILSRPKCVKISIIRLPFKPIEDVNVWSRQRNINSTDISAITTLRLGAGLQ